MNNCKFSDREKIMDLHVWLLYWVFQTKEANKKPTHCQVQVSFTKILKTNSTELSQEIIPI